MHSTPLDLDAIQARADAATPGPWFAHEDWPGRVFAESEFNAHVARVTGSNPEPNERFIAAARTDVPALLAEVRRLRAERDEFCNRVDTLTAVAKGNKRHVQEMYRDLQQSRRENDQLRAELAAVTAVHEKGEHNGHAICLHCASQMFPPPESGIWSESAYPCATLRALGITAEQPAPVVQSRP